MNEPDYLGAGARLSGGPAAPLAQLAFAHELQAASHLWDGLGLADIAHTVALHQAEVVPDEAAAELLAALLELQSVPLDPVVLDPEVGDVYNNRERQLRALAGAATGHLPAGRARREATTIAWQLACRDGLVDLGLALADFIEASTALAQRHQGTLMPDYTYLQHAHPTTLAHYLLGHIAPFVRHLDRIDRALELVDRSPAGSGSVNGTSIPLDRRLLADLLGFGEVLTHTRDAMWAPDMVIDQIAVISAVLTSVDRLAEELQLWATAEFGVVELADEHCRTSVVMPQKKNPYALSYLRGTARHRIPESSGIIATMLTPSGQPENRTYAYLWTPEVLAETTRAVRLLGDVLVGASFAVDRMNELAHDGFTAATEICDRLTLDHGIDNRAAHRIIGRAVRSAIDDGRTSISSRDVAEASAEFAIDLPRLSDEWLHDVAEPGAIVSRRTTLGGAGSASVQAMASAAVASARQHRESWLQRRSLWSPSTLVSTARKLHESLRQGVPDAR